jgi:hypothetical protein
MPIFDPRNPPQSHELHKQFAGDSVDEEMERKLAEEHGATTCAEQGHDWDIAAAGGGMWTLDCTRPDCHLIHDSEEGYVWNAPA